MLILVSLVTVGLLTAPVFAGSWGHCDQTFQTGFPAGGKLSIEVRPGDVEIWGADVSTNHSGAQFQMEVPRRSGLYVRSKARNRKFSMSPDGLFRGFSQESEAQAYAAREFDGG